MQTPLLIKNVEIFDGIADRLTAGHVLVEGRTIAAVDDTARQSTLMTRLGDFYSAVEALKMVTSGNAELFRMAGERDPYRAARLGEITAGAWADMLLVDGDPTTNLSLLDDPAANLVLIVKDGVIVKNTLPGT